MSQYRPDSDEENDAKPEIFPVLNKSAIPEITEDQLKLLKQITYDPNMSVFSQTSPLPTDPLTSQIIMAQAEKDVDYLCGLGFIKDITADHMEQVQKTNESSGRNWRVFELRPLGRAMFQADLSTVVN